MLSPLIPSETSGFSSYRFATDEYSPPSSQSNSDGSTQYGYRYEGQVSSYQVLLSGDTVNNQEALTYSKLTQGYQFTSLNVNKVAEGVAVEDTPPLLDGAKNILNFIETRLANEKAAGASDGTLSDLLNEGLKGFTQGFAEAEAILTTSGGLNDTVTTAIGTLYQQVVDGITMLRDKYTDTAGSSPSEAVSTATLTPRVQGPEDSNGVGATAVYSSYTEVNQNYLGQTLVDSSNSDLIRQLSSLGNQFRAITRGGEDGNLNSLRDNQLNDLVNNGAAVSKSDVVAEVSDIPESSLINAQLEYGRKDRFSFELTTLDGDKIIINASNTAVYYGEYGETQQDKGKQLVEGLKDNGRFSISVTGELDDGEAKAIKDLVDQVMMLADEFYNGDINKAYEAALDLGYDQNEIASYALQLNQVEQYKVAAAYQDFMPEQDQLSKGNGTIFSPIGDYARNILDTLNDPLNYGLFDYSQLLSGISQEIDRQIKPEPGPSFSAVVAILEGSVLNNTLAK